MASSPSCLDEPAFIANADDDTRMLHKRRVLDETRKEFAKERDKYSERKKELAAREQEVAAQELAFQQKLKRFAIYCDDQHEKRIVERPGREGVSNQSKYK
ncbi:hypothetical protein THAOC_19857 [Thalassiosira oceanica]|uniref:Uncharacterized protein n=1 Tax=Thalassiosira oceanica TaxID=159749 RepID=K0S1D3_THAOC|nr:hypothetical protein THAOC_19857 [Thalassiosira oceanica]|eukprot:EJK59868.1 hypothetical protein THAOC_19857 [Thalassiosira oceanica]